MNPMILFSMRVSLLDVYVTMGRESTTEQSLGGNAADLVGLASQDTHGNRN